MYMSEEASIERKNVIEITLNILLKERAKLNRSIQMLEEEKKVLNSLDNIRRMEREDNLITVNAERSNRT